jgi:RNA polymerase sigma factor (sigma-70 family)
MIRALGEPNPGVSTLDDASLISIIQQNEGSRDNCKNEISELYRRHAKDVYKMTVSLCGNDLEGVRDAEDLFQKAWEQAIEKIKKYDINAKNTFGAWVKGIADNLFLEDYRLKLKRDKAHNEIGYLLTKGEGNEPLDDDDSMFADILGESEETAEPDQMIGRSLLVEVLDLLSPVEREILIEWHRTYDRNEPGNPTHVENLERLSQKYGMQKESIRKIKLRAIKKIQKKLNL